MQMVPEEEGILRDDDQLFPRGGTFYTIFYQVGTYSTVPYLCTDPYNFLIIYSDLKPYLPTSSSAERLRLMILLHLREFLAVQYT